MLVIVVAWALYSVMSIVYHRYRCNVISYRDYYEFVAPALSSSRVPTLYFRGAAHYAHFYMGIVEGVRQSIQTWPPGSYHVQGASAGCVAALCLVADLDTVKLGQQVESLVPRDAYHRIRACLRQQMVERHYDEYEKLCTLNHRFRIVAWDWLTFQPVVRYEWNTLDHLLDCVMGSMTIPLVTGWHMSVSPVTETCQLSDMVSSDMYLGHLSSHRNYCPHVILISPLNRHAHIHPSRVLPWCDALTPVSSELKQYLVQEGREQWQRFANHYHQQK